MTDRNGDRRASGEGFFSEDFAVKCVVAIVILMCILAFAMALNGLNQRDGAAAQMPAANSGAATGYFPDGYVNRATEIEIQPPTF